MDGGNACGRCIHASECMEQRGQCTEYQDYENIIRQAAEDIARLNEEQRGDGE